MYDMKKPRFFRRFTLDVSGTRPLRRKSEVLSMRKRMIALPNLGIRCFAGQQAVNDGADGRLIRRAQSRAHHIAVLI